LVAEIEGRLQAQQKLLGKIVGLMFPTLFGCRRSHELTRLIFPFDAFVQG
jgi:hypothetical protein